MSFTIKRGPLAADNYTIIANALLRDHRLSLKARGLAAWLLTHRDDFELSLPRIAELNGCGEASVRTAVEELEKVGYLRREQSRADGSGKFSSSVYYITDVAVSAGEDRQTVFHRRETRERENQAHKKTTSLEDHLEEGSAAGASDGQGSLPLPGVQDELAKRRDARDEGNAKPLTTNQLAIKIAQRAHDRSRGMVNMGATISLAKTALEAGYEARRVDEVIRYLQQQNWKLTKANLHQQLEGGPRPPGKTPTTTHRPQPRTGGMVIEGPAAT
jgi:hypothetical protein